MDETPAAVAARDQLRASLPAFTARRTRLAWWQWALPVALWVLLVLGGFAVERHALHVAAAGRPVTALVHHTAGQQKDGDSCRARLSYPPDPRAHRTLSLSCGLAFHTEIAAYLGPDHVLRLSRPTAHDLRTGPYVAAVLVGLPALPALALLTGLFVLVRQRRRDRPARR